MPNRQGSKQVISFGSQLFRSTSGNDLVVNSSSEYCEC